MWQIKWPITETQAWTSVLVLPWRGYNGAVTMIGRGKPPQAIKRVGKNVWEKEKVGALCLTIRKAWT